MAIATVVSIVAERRGSSDGNHDASPTANVIAVTPTPVGTPILPGRLPEGATGLLWPIEGGCLPDDDTLMPGADRGYRGGVHEGVDFYDSDNCVTIGVNTEVLAAKGGIVIRADVDYQDLTAVELDRLDALIEEGRANDPDVVDAFRGRQIWIDHGDGIVARYAHLNGIAEEITEGVQVEAGQLIGYVGESGTPSSVDAPGGEVHLHFEVRVGDTYLGLGLDPDAVRELYEEAFAD